MRTKRKIMHSHGAWQRFVPAAFGIAGFLCGCLICFFMRGRLSEIPPEYLTLRAPDPGSLSSALARQLRFFVWVSCSALSAYALIFPSFLVFLRSAEAAFAACSLFRLRVSPLIAVSDTLAGIGICLLLCACAHLSDCFHRNVPKKNAVMIADYALRQLYITGCAAAVFLMRTALLLPLCQT